MNLKLLLIIFIGCLLSSCTTNSLDIDVSDVKINEVNALRLDEDLFRLKSGDFNTKNLLLIKKHGSFYDKYIRSFLDPKGVNSAEYKDSVFHFTADKTMLLVNKYILTLYPQSKIQAITLELNQSIKRYKYYFKNKVLPKRFITCQSGFNFSVAYTDTSLVTGLDMYLGDTAVFYKMLQLPAYQTRCMNENYVLPDLVRGWMLTEFDNLSPVNNLLNHTIFYGKIYYCVKALLPYYPDSLIFSYTKKQLDYCSKFEKNIWNFFTEKNKLYENDLKFTQEVTGDGPFCRAISKECPPRIAMYVGYKIIKSYFNNNKNATLQNLMQETDAQKILSKSKYRP
ncbi:MAG: hypothetical protein JSU07_03310 [Bacteroidetes bacterium]|nr:hypothetical protein [Bacteroidota bacterium]